MMALNGTWWVPVISITAIVLALVIGNLIGYWLEHRLP
jgi:uncharacterized protein YneF (UPF0154 family)